MHHSLFLFKRGVGNLVYVVEFDKPVERIEAHPTSDIFQRLANPFVFIGKPPRSIYSCESSVMTRTPRCRQTSLRSLFSVPA